MFCFRYHRETILFVKNDTSELFDVQEYAKQVEYLKNNSARILNNVFRVSLSKVLKKTLFSCKF
jgi:hypothetical protein